MFKQSKKSPQGQAPQSSSSIGRTARAGQTVPKQVLQFLVRQIGVLKDIAQSSPKTHPDIITNRLLQCVHLMEKKLSFSLGDNPQQYYDYIQDFYENQLNSLRQELNGVKIQLVKQKREVDDVKTSYQILLREKQQYMHSLQTSRVSKQNGLEFYQENSKLKKELDHCRILLQQNTGFIEEQAKAIDSLSHQLRSKQKQQKALQQQHTNKILMFDDYVNKQKLQMEASVKALTAEHKNYQSQLKQLTFAKIRIMDQRANLQKELEMKVEEIQLLTKKILEDEITMNRLQRTLIMKQKLVEELYQEIDSVNGNLSRFGKKEGDYQRTCEEKNQQIMKLEERIRIITDMSQKLERKNIQSSKKIEDLLKQYQELKNELQEARISLHRVQNQKDNSHRKLNDQEKTISKLMKDKERYEKELQIMEERYQDLYQRSKQQKQNVKKEIMTEINELIEMVKTKQTQVNQLTKQKSQLAEQLKKERQGRSEVDTNFGKMNDLMSEIQRKIEFLQGQNASLLQTKGLLQQELQKLNKEFERLVKVEQQNQNLQSEKKNLRDELEVLRKIESQVITSQKSINRELEKKETQLEQSFIDQRKQYKELLNKKDFQIKQLQSKVKILQEELRDASKLFENQKFKMSLKIKELEELLKQRYDYSSRFSHQSDVMG